MPDTSHSGHIYKVVEIVGSSQEGVDDAIRSAVSRASQTLRGLDWFEVREIRGMIHDGDIGWFQVKVGIGFRVLDPADLERE